MPLTHSSSSTRPSRSASRRPRTHVPRAHIHRMHKQSSRVLALKQRRQTRDIVPLKTRTPVKHTPAASSQMHTRRNHTCTLNLEMTRSIQSTSLKTNSRRNPESSPATPSSPTFLTPNAPPVSRPTSSPSKHPQKFTTRKPGPPTSRSGGDPAQSNTARAKSV